MDDEKYGKRLRAYVVPPTARRRRGDAQGPREENLARYKVPREIMFIDEMPRNPAGKVVKRELPDPDAIESTKSDEVHDEGEFEGEVGLTDWPGQSTARGPRGCPR